MAGEWGGGRACSLSCQLCLSPSQTLVLKILLSDFVIIHNGGILWQFSRPPENRRYVCAPKVRSALSGHPSLSVYCFVWGEIFSVLLSVSAASCSRTHERSTKNVAPLGGKCNQTQLWGWLINRLPENVAKGILNSHFQTRCWLCADARANLKLNLTLEVAYKYKSTWLSL